MAFTRTNKQLLQPNELGRDLPFTDSLPHSARCSPPTREASLPEARCNRCSRRCAKPRGSRSLDPSRWRTNLVKPHCGSNTLRGRDACPICRNALSRESFAPAAATCSQGGMRVLLSAATRPQWSDTCPICRHSLPLARQRAPAAACSRVSAAISPSVLSVPPYFIIRPCSA